MNNIFRRLPLPVKLLLIGVIPLAFLIYTSFQIYGEKTEKINLFTNYADRLHQSAYINTLIDRLEKERKFSFDYAMRKDGRNEVIAQRPQTDSAMQHLENSTLSGFKNYTFLKDLQHVRSQIDSGHLSAWQVMHYYTTAIFRINTLNAVSPGAEVYLEPVYKDLVGQKLLSEMITNLGIIRSNIYNVLYTKKYMAETLAGMIGVHDVYKTYETEFLLKASPEAIQSYKNIRTTTSLKPAIEYIDTLFKQFKQDSSYTADNWWSISNDAMEQLTKLRRELWANVVAGENAMIQNEKAVRSRTLIFLLLGLLFAAGIIIYTIFSITGSLREMKAAAQKISEGAIIPQLSAGSKDAIGSLAQSISKINETNRMLADTADAIGNGDFDVSVKPRSKEDILGNAIVRMKNNLLQSMRVIKERNEQLIQSAEKYKTIFNKSPLPKWIYDFDSLQFLDVNETAIKHYGYSREEFLVMTLTDIRPGEEQEEFLTHIKQLKAGHGPKKRYWRHIKKNGEIITVEISAHFIEYNNRNARIAVMIDITEKLRAEEKLAASEKRFRSIIEQFPFPVVTYDPDGNYTSVNKAWELMWQTKREDVKEYNIRKDPQMIASGLSVYVEKAFGGELAVSEPYLYDPALIGHPSALKRWMVMTLYPLKGSKNEVLEVILVLQDITESKNAEEVVRKTEEKRRLIMNAALDAIVTIDKNSIITFWNPPAEKMFGWKEEEIKGKSLMETIIPVKYREQHKKGMSRYFQTGEGPVLNRLIEISAMDKGGKEFPIELSIIPVEQGDEKTFCAFIRDISERKKAEERLKRSHEELRQLASHLQNIREDERAGIAREIHDELGQQITCIKMDVAWLLKRAKTDDPKEQEKANAISEMIDHTAVTVRKIATELRPSILDDFGLIDAMEWQGREFQKRSGINLDFDSAVIATVIPQNITTALFRIYQESLTNVARHADATEVKVTVSLKNDELILTIMDNGKGFDMSGTAQKKTLGLLGMRERTLMIGGKYEISSMPGKGTTVKVIVPLLLKEMSAQGSEKL